MDELNSLTSREREIALLVATGASNRRVASVLGIKERTVKCHMTAIFKKTNTNSRFELAIIMIKPTANHHRLTLNNEDNSAPG